jgi:hypothetical protein
MTSVREGDSLKGETTGMMLAPVRPLFEEEEAEVLDRFATLWSSP